MDLNTFIIAVFYEVDNWFAGQKKLRQRGPESELSDSEMLTMEIVGEEFLGIDAQKALYAYFKRHYGEWFPALRGGVHRTSFTRQMANLLWVAKERLWRHLLRAGWASTRGSAWWTPSRCPFAVSPAPTAAAFCPRSRPSATTRWPGRPSRAASAPAHLCWPGVIVGMALAPADAHDLTVAEELLEGAEGWALGDRNYYWSPKLTERLEDEGLCLLAPYKSKKKEKKPWPRWLVQKRRRIETVLGQLVERYRAKKVRARDRWHLTSRWLRKVLSHTMSVFLCEEETVLLPLRFAHLLTD